MCKDSGHDGEYSELKNCSTLKNLKMVLRCELIEWMSNICKNFALETDVLHLTVLIYHEASHYLLDKDSSLKLDDYVRKSHLYAITSLVISIKIYSSKKLKINSLLELLTQGEYSKDSILKSEILILKVMKFKIPQINSFIDFSHKFTSEMCDIISDQNFDFTFLFKHDQAFATHLKINKISEIIFKILLTNQNFCKKLRNDEKTIYVSIIFISLSLLQSDLSEANKLKLYRNFSQQIQYEGCSCEKTCKYSRLMASIIEDLLSSKYYVSKHLKSEFEENFQW